MLIIFSFLVLSVVSYILWDSFSKDKITQVPTLSYIYFGLGIVFSTVNVLYHVKSFRFYRRKEKRNLDKKLSKILWIGTLCFSGFILYLMVTALYKNLQQYRYDNFSLEETLFIFILVFLGLLGLLEVSVLKKRINRLTNKLDVKEEINDIGDNSTL